MALADSFVAGTQLGQQFTSAFNSSVARRRAGLVDTILKRAIEAQKAGDDALAEEQLAKARALEKERGIRNAEALNEAVAGVRESAQGRQRQQQQDAFVPSLEPQAPQAPPSLQTAPPREGFSFSPGGAGGNVLSEDVIALIQQEALQNPLQGSGGAALAGIGTLPQGIEFGGRPPNAGTPAQALEFALRRQAFNQPQQPGSVGGFEEIASVLGAAGVGLTEAQVEALIQASGGG